MASRCALVRSDAPSQGTFYRLRRLATGVLMATGSGETEDLGTDVRNLLILQGIQLFRHFVGSLVAG
jgi:hypothetical protein